VQITPATTVSYSWDTNSRTLAVTPVSGNLAPNTQYQVTIGPGAKTASNQQLASPQTITFVTQPPAPTPSPSPPPRPTPSNPLNEKIVAPLSGASSPGLQWSADSSSIYFVDGKGALQVVSLKDGKVTAIATSGAGYPSISPAGDRLAWIAGGKIEVITFATGKTAELVPTSPPTMLGWAKDRLLWAAHDGIYQQTDSGQTQLTALPATTGVIVQSIAPDGTHAIYTLNTNLFVLDLATGKSAQLGQANDSFAGWSPDATLVLYTDADHVVVADAQGATQSTLVGGEASWSSQDAIILGSDTNLYQVRPDGTNRTRLADGTYRFPVWAPDGSSFAFVRGDSLWTGVAPALPPEPTPVEEAGAVVKTFMDARLNGKSDAATALLDDSGKKAYAPDGLNLVITGDPHFSRYYVLTQEAIGTQPDTVRIVVRLVLTHGKLDVSEYEETLALARDAKTRQFLIDQATAGQQRELGKGAEVVSVEVTQNTIQVAFDSDLDQSTVNGGVLLLDSKGNQVDATVSYANRTVTLSGLDLKEKGQYKLVVLTTLKDVQGHNVAAEYDLNVFGPSAKKHANHHDTVVPSPSPIASSSNAPG
jgi:hypothetical protein